MATDQGPGRPRSGGGRTATGEGGRDAPRWTRLDTDERRAQILRAAQALFSNRPYSAVSTTDIAEAAGVTRGLLHHYFGGKRDLYLEAVKGLVREPSLPVAPPGDHASPDPDVWVASVDLWLSQLETNKDSWLVALQAGETGRDAELQSIFDQARENTATQVLRALGLDQDAGPALRALVRGYGGFAQEIVLEWLQRERLTRDQVRALLVQTMPLMVRELLPALGPGA